jgi:hypothetical protein
MALVVFVPFAVVVLALSGRIMADVVEAVSRMRPVRSGDVAVLAVARVCPGGAVIYADGAGNGWLRAGSGWMRVADVAAVCGGGK